MSSNKLTSILRTVATAALFFVLLFCSASFFSGLVGPVREHSKVAWLLLLAASGVLLGLFVVDPLLNFSRRCVAALPLRRIHHLHYGAHDGTFHFGLFPGRAADVGGWRPWRSKFPGTTFYAFGRIFVAIEKPLPSAK